ncbi:class I SAM-dependent methyltransferase [Candidatus Pacearchaeota archaeon]|nr:class I SAM-dependent methyltransferase [Candidatus Pacearchaeota archaeon]
MIELPQTNLTTYRIEDTLFSDGFKMKDPRDYFIGRETSFSKNNSLNRQKEWIPMRLGTLEASREIVKETFPEGCGAEFGCGAYGWFYNYLLPEGRRLIQFDINPKAVGNNREYTVKLFKGKPEIAVGSLYEMPLKNSSLDFIVGFNSWDSIYFFEKSVEEVRRCLRPGGFFVHYQNLQPAEMPLVLTESKKRIGRGLEKDVDVGSHVRSTPLYLPGTNVPIGEERERIILTINSLDWEEIRLGTYLMRHLADLFEKAGFRIGTYQEIKRETLTKKKEFARQLKSHGFGFDERKFNENCFETAYGTAIMSCDSSLPKKLIKQIASMDVFIAQKQ